MPGGDDCRFIGPIRVNFQSAALHFFSEAMDSIFPFPKSSLQRSIRILGFVPLMMSLAIASPAAERGSGASSQELPQGLVVKEAPQTGRLRFLHNSTITLCPGGTPDISRWRNHRMRSETSTQSRRDDRPGLVRRPSGAGIDSPTGSGGYAALHHRLISAAPPAL
jgi:hypothetical protein